jgi:glycosyltransferase involved in cell wall biosynthesis
VKIVHVCIGAGTPVFTSHGGAIQRRVTEMALAQLRRGHDVTVFSPGPESRRTEVRGVAVNYMATRITDPWKRLEYQVRVTTAIRRSHRDADVLHFHSEPEGALLSRGLQAMQVMSYDYYYFRGLKKGSRLYPLYRRALMAYDILLPCSYYCQSASCAYWDIPFSHTQVLFNGVNVKQFRPDAEAAEAERATIGVEGKVVVYLGRVCNQKGTDTLLEAYSEVRRSLPRTSLLIVGPIGHFADEASGAEEASWLGRMREAGATYLGTVHEDRLAGLLNLADVFVMPTREFEMFGMAAVEAQACGAPVIASDHGGLREVVTDRTGRRFPPGDAASLARTLVALLSDDELRARLGRGATENAQRYSWERVAGDFDAIYSARARAAEGQAHGL